MESLAARESPEIPNDVEITDIAGEARAGAAFDGHERVVRAVDRTAGLHPEGFSPERAGERIAAIGWTLAEIFERADREGTAPGAVADRIAKERIASPARRSW